MRKHNEDAFLELPEAGLWLVADGMGGHSSGDMASQLIVERLGQMPRPSTASDFLIEVRTRLAEVNDILRQTAESRGPGTIIASTVVALLTFGQHFAAVWAGDSRLYLFRDQRLSQITEDHSHVQEMVRMGILDEEEASRHPNANVVTRAIGAHEELELQVVQDRIQPGDIFLLCSDGLTRMMADEEIENTLSRGELNSCLEELIQTALDRGAKDNVTTVLVEAQLQEQAGPEDETTVVATRETI